MYLKSRPHKFNHCAWPHKLSGRSFN